MVTLSAQFPLFYISTAVHQPRGCYPCATHHAELDAGTNEAT